MHKRCTISAFSVLALVLVSVACTSILDPAAMARREPTNAPEPTSGSIIREVSIAGPGCPDSFQENQDIRVEVEIRANGLLTLTLGSTPSVPCGWHTPEIDDDSVVRRVDHKSEWPIEGVTPVPGAPGTDVWIFETCGQGESTISLECVCLAEEGSGKEVSGVYLLNVIVSK